jgi:hypothetical protein
MDETAARGLDPERESFSSGPLSYSEQLLIILFLIHVFAYLCTGM